MEQRPFSRERNGLHYTGMVLMVGGVIAVILLLVFGDPLVRPWCVPLLFFVILGIFLKALAKPRALPPGYMQRQRRALVLTMAIVTLIALPFGAWNLIEGYSSQNWPKVEGDVVSSKVARHGGHGTSYTPSISYHYELGGAHYMAERLAFPGPSYDDRNSAQMIVDRYPKGKRITVFYSLNNLGRAVLEPGISVETWFAPAVGMISLSIFLFFVSRKGGGL